MRTPSLMIFLGFLVCICPRILAQPNNYNGVPGHARIDHSHSTDCGDDLGGVCYGYAIGTILGYSSSSACNPMTMVSVSCDNADWQLMGISDSKFEYVEDKTLNINQEIIVKFNEQHVAYAGQGAVGAPSTLGASHIRSAGVTFSESLTLTKNPDGSYKLRIVENGIAIIDQDSKGYWKSKTSVLQGQNKFFNGANSTLNQGFISVAGSTGTSPMTTPGLDWNSSYSIVATNHQSYPTTFFQAFSNWENPNGSNGGTNLTLTGVYPGTGKYTAVFYQSAQITFSPSGGGSISAFGETRSSSFGKYCKATPGQGEYVTATASESIDNSLLTRYVFTKWTKANSTDTSFAPVISFYSYASQS
jgi:hypothetical protein